MLAVGDHYQAGLADQRREATAQPTPVGDDGERVEPREHRVIAGTIRSGDRDRGCDSLSVR